MTKEEFENSKNLLFHELFKVNLGSESTWKDCSRIIQRHTSLIACETNKNELLPINQPNILGEKV